MAYIDEIRLDTETMQRACLRCGKGGGCRWYQFDRDNCPHIRDVKRALILSALSISKANQTR